MVTPTEAPKRGRGRPTHDQTLATARAKEAERAAQSKRRRRFKKEDVVEAPSPVSKGDSVTPNRSEIKRRISPRMLQRLEEGRAIEREYQTKIARWKRLVKNTKNPDVVLLGAKCGLYEWDVALAEERFGDAVALIPAKQEQERRDREEEQKDLEDGRPMSIVAVDGSTDIVRQVYSSRAEAKRMAEQYPGTEFIANYSKSDGNRVRIRYWVGKYGIMRSADVI